MFDKIKSDYKAIFDMDPAANSRLAVIFTYSSFHAVVLHRLAHWVYRMGMPFFARLISQVARFLTGIEIHPAAKISGSFVIDHGMGVVIGETTEIGEHVLVFQGATLGGTGKERGKRHPTIGNHVVIGAGSKVLGAITIGDHVKVGANSVVLRSVPPHSTVVGVPGRVVRVHGEKTAEAAMLDHIHMPDPMNEMLTKLQKQVTRLEQRLEGKPVQPQKEDSPQGGQGGQAKKSRSRKRSSRGGQDAGVAGVVVEQLPVETVQERQARMARMEKDERMKGIALRRQREHTQAQEQPGEGQPPAEGAPKKRTRRRRKSQKPGGPGEQGGHGGEGQADQGGESSGGGAERSGSQSENREPVSARVASSGGGEE